MGCVILTFSLYFHAQIGHYIQIYVRLCLQIHIEVVCGNVMFANIKFWGYSSFERNRCKYVVNFIYLQSTSNVVRRCTHSNIYVLVWDVCIVYCTQTILGADIHWARIAYTYRYLHAAVAARIYRDVHTHTHTRKSNIPIIHMSEWMSLEYASIWCCQYQIVWFDIHILLFCSSLFSILYSQFVWEH